MTAWRLLLQRLVGGLLVAHLGGVVVLVLAVAVEARQGELAALLAARVPSAWALAAAVLTLLGSALAVARMRRAGIILALGTLGLGPGRVVVIATLLGGLVGAGATQVMRPAPDATGWERIPGGWQAAGVVIADEPGVALAPRTYAPKPVVLPADAIPVGAAAGALGVALGLHGGALAPIIVGALLLMGEAVVSGLVDRRVWPAAAVVGPAILLCATFLLRWWRAPLFPGR